MRSFLADTRSAVGHELARWSARAQVEMEEPVGAAMAYSLAVPGKRLRPALVMAAYRELGGCGNAAELAAAVEVVHTYSLVHDDLPCMDDDDLRRGRPTTHRAFGPAVAVDAAFRMVLLSARMLAAGAARLGLDRDVLGALATELYHAAGAQGMIRGQVLDLEAEGKHLTPDALNRIHHAKTGALITASAVMGAIAARALPEEVAAVRAYGAEIGLVFQIVDDVLDATASSAELGKTAGKDAERHKATYAGVLGIEAARAAAAEHATRAVDHLGSIRLDSPLLSALANLMLARRS